MIPLDPETLLACVEAMNDDQIGRLALAIARCDGLKQLREIYLREAEALVDHGHVSPTWARELKEDVAKLRQAVRSPFWGASEALMAGPESVADGPALAAVGLDWKAEQALMRAEAVNGPNRAGDGHGYALPASAHAATEDPGAVSVGAIATPRSVRDAVRAAHALGLSNVPDGGWGPSPLRELTQGRGAPMLGAPDTVPGKDVEVEPARDVVLLPAGSEVGLLAARCRFHGAGGLIHPDRVFRRHWPSRVGGVAGFGNVTLTLEDVVAPRPVFREFFERFGDVTKAAGNMLRLSVPGMEDVEVVHGVITSVGPVIETGPMHVASLTLIGTRLRRAEPIPARVELGLGVAIEPVATPDGVRRKIKAMHAAFREAFHGRQTPKSTSLVADDVRVTPLDCGGVMDGVAAPGLTAKGIEVRCLKPAAGEDKGRAVVTLRDVAAPEPVFLAMMIRYGDPTAVEGNTLRISRGRAAGDLEIRDCALACPGPRTVADDGMMTVATLEIVGADTRRIPPRALRGRDEPVAVSLECPPLRDADEEVGPPFIVADFDAKTKEEILKNGFAGPNIMGPTAWFKGDIREILAANSIKDRLAEADDRELRSPQAIKSDAARTDRPPASAMLELLAVDPDFVIPFRVVEAGHPDPVWNDPSPAVIEAAIADGNMVTAMSTWDESRQEYIPDDVAMLRQLQANSRKHAGPVGDPGTATVAKSEPSEADDKAREATREANRARFEAGLDIALRDAVRDDLLAAAGPAEADVARYWAEHDARQLALKDASTRWERAHARWRRLFGTGPIPMQVMTLPAAAELDAVEAILYDKESKGIEPARCSCGCGFVIGCKGPGPEVTAPAGVAWAQAHERWRQFFGGDAIPMARMALPALPELRTIQALIHAKEHDGVDPPRCPCGCGYVIGCAVP